MENLLNNLGPVLRFSILQSICQEIITSKGFDVLNSDHQKSNKVAKVGGWSECLNLIYGTTFFVYRACFNKYFPVHSNDRVTYLFQHTNLFYDILTRAKQ